MRKVAFRGAMGRSNAMTSSKSFDTHFDLDSGATAITTSFDDYPAFYYAGATNATGVPNSSRAIHFHQLTESILRLAALPDHDPMHIDDDTSQYAINLVGLLRGQFDIDAPLFFPQDAEALVLTWDLGKVKRLLTIAGDEVSLLDLNKSTQGRCYHEISDGKEAMGDLLPLLSESSLMRSSVLED